jgi:hypothetical protein
VIPNKDGFTSGEGALLSVDWAGRITVISNAGKRNRKDLFIDGVFNFMMQRKEEKIKYHAQMNMRFSSIEGEWFYISLRFPGILLSLHSPNRPHNIAYQQS